MDKLTSNEFMILKKSIERCKEKLGNTCILEQLNNLKVQKRQNTVVGFYTDFYLDNPEKYYIKNFNEFIGIGAELKDIKHGANFTVFIKDGLIVTLEGVCYDENWPESFIIKKFL